MTYATSIRKILKMTDFSEFQLKECDNISQAHFKTNEMMVAFYRYYLLIMALPVRRIAFVVAKHNGHLPSNFESAIIAACAELDLGRATVTKIWGNYRKGVKSRVIQTAWFEELTVQYGGTNAVIEMQEAGKLPFNAPDDYFLEGIEEKEIARINRDVETDNVFF